MTKNELCNISGCGKIATIKCGTWYFCTKDAVEIAGVVLNEKGRGDGVWGSAYAIDGDPRVIAAVRSTQEELVIRIPYQPAHRERMSEHNSDD